MKNIMKCTILFTDILKYGMHDPIVSESLKVGGYFLIQEKNVQNFYVCFKKIYILQPFEQVYLASWENVMISQKTLEFNWSANGVSVYTRTNILK